MKKELVAALQAARKGLELSEKSIEEIVEHAKQNSNSVKSRADALVWTIGYLQAMLDTTVKNLEAIEGADNGA